MDRRLFVSLCGAAATAVGGGARKAAAAPAALAIDGGAPIRKTPLRTRHFGPLFYGDGEWQNLVQVFKERAPFRWWGMGDKVPDKVATFEQEFAKFMTTRFALGVTSGTTALQTALAALGIGPGDEVIMPAWTWHSCFNTVVLAGALPVCAEVDDSFNLDPADVERHITPQTKVLMIVHLQGNPADMDRLLPIARKHNLKVLEDVSQAVGASYKGKPLGSMGDIGIASLQVNKTISAGEGGAVYTNDPVLYERAIRFHDMGSIRAPMIERVGGKSRVDTFIGTNYRMNEFTGAVLLGQIRQLDTVVRSIRGVAGQVYEGVRDLEGIRMRLLPDPAGELGAGVYIKFPSKVVRDQFRKAMAAENVPVSPPQGSVILPLEPHIQKKVTVHPAWPSFASGRGKAMVYGPQTCPKTIEVIDTFAGVLLDPKFSKQDVQDAVAAIRKVYPAVMSRARQA
jgi:8-amino-3,8-dideoxy-alpha-D-manno-octulosonate transaminase